jgi:hypothetical protein
VYGTPKEKEFRTLDGYENEKRSLEYFVTTNYKELTLHTLANILMSHKVLNDNMDSKK